MYIENKQNDQTVMVCCVSVCGKTQQKWYKSELRVHEMTVSRSRDEHRQLHFKLQRKK